MSLTLGTELDEPVRLRAVREGYFGGVTSLSEVADLYLRWVSYDEAILVVEHNETRNSWSHHFFKARKRGNDVHEFVMHNELDPLIQYGRGRTIDFFEDDNRLIWSERTSRAFTRAVYMTLEYDSNRFNLKDAWLRLQHDFNLFLAKLRKHFGKISYVRTVEAHYSNMPHVHVVVIFKEHEFKVFKYRRKNGDVAFLVNSADRDLLKSLWSYAGKQFGFGDIVALQNYGNTMSYICKYIMKFNSDLKKLSGNEGEYMKSLYTLTLNWVFHKKAYSMSKDFLEVVERYRRDAAKHKSNLEGFVDLDGERKFKRWRLDDDGSLRFDIVKFYYGGSYSWLSAVNCSDYSVLNLAKVPFVLRDVDISRLSINDKIKLDFWNKEIESYNADKRDYWIVSSSGAKVYDGEHWVDELVCRHCLKCHGTGDKIKAHVDGGKCHVLNERKKINDLRLRDIENYFI